jgi:hypothetical protein
MRISLKSWEVIAAVQVCVAELQDERDRSSVGSRDKTDLKQRALAKALQSERGFGGASRVNIWGNKNPPEIPGGLADNGV